MRLILDMSNSVVQADLNLESHRSAEMEQFMVKAIQEEVDRNYEVFSKLLPTLLPTQRGRFALMKDGAILSYFSTMEDARAAAVQFIPDNVYSIQQVTDTALNLGFYTSAIVIN